MKKSLCALLVTLVTFVPLANSQTIVTDKSCDTDKIKPELEAKYKAFNCRLEDQTVEMWDTYFLKSPNIGNMHEGRPEIGWDTVHEGSIKFVESKPEGEMAITDLEFYPIDCNNAWVKGTMVITTSNGVFKAGFYDSLVKTVEGWRVILSVVSPEHK